jgi:predicted lipoprotein with Yx(FWY)xxD motif
MKRALLTLLLPFALAACGTAAANYGGGAPQSSPSGLATISVGGSSLGQILVDVKGRTLYLFEADTGKQSTCSGACAQAWPPLTTNGAPTAAGNASPSLLGTTTRSDGTMQATYSGHPLYYFASDTKSGDTKGEGLTAFGAGWDVLSPNGAKIEKSGSSGSYGSYGSY